MNFIKCSVIIIILSISLLFISFSSHGQNVWLDHHNDAITLDLSGPFFKESIFEFPTGVISLSSRFTLNDQLTGVVDLPFAISRIDAGFQGVGSFTESGLGNIYLGINIKRDGGAFVNELGIRLPTISDRNLISNSVGFIGNFDRLEFFGEDIVSVASRSNYYFNNEGNAKFRLRGGPNFLISTFGGGTELLLDYGGQFIYEKEEIYLKVGVIGQFLVSESGSFGELSNHSFGLGIDFNEGNFHPGFNLRIPLDEEFKNVLNAVLSLNVTYDFN